MIGDGFRKRDCAAARGDRFGELSVLRIRGRKGAKILRFFLLRQPARLPRATHRFRAVAQVGHPTSGAQPGEIVPPRGGLRSQLHRGGQVGDGGGELSPRRFGGGEQGERLGVVGLLPQDLGQLRNRLTRLLQLQPRRGEQQAGDHLVLAEIERPLQVLRGFVGLIQLQTDCTRDAMQQPIRRRRREPGAGDSQRVGRLAGGRQGEGKFLVDLRGKRIHSEGAAEQENRRGIVTRGTLGHGQLPEATRIVRRKFERVLGPASGFVGAAGVAQELRIQQSEASVLGELFSSGGESLAGPGRAIGGVVVQSQE